MRMSATSREILKDGRTEREEMPALEEGLRRGRVSTAELEAFTGPQFVDTLEAGVGDAIWDIAKRRGKTIVVDRPIEAHELDAVKALLEDGTVLKAGQPNDKKAVTLVQRALMALANRLARPELALKAWGADGDYGTEATQAVRAFQTAFMTKYDLEVTGAVDRKTLEAIQAELAPTRAPEVLSAELAGKVPGSRSLVHAARWLIDKDGPNYATDREWKCRDPNHVLYGSQNPPVTDATGTYSLVDIGGSGWKCNFFVNTAVYLAGFTPARYQGSHGNYSVAVDMHRFTDRIQGANSQLAVFEHLGAVENAQDIPPETRRRAIGLMLAQARPGDLLIVQHGRDRRGDAGHCRLITETQDWRRGAGTIKCAQATATGAAELDHTIDDFMGKYHVWLMRPRRPRQVG